MPFFFSRNRIGVDDSKETLDKQKLSNNCRKMLFFYDVRKGVKKFLGSVFEVAGPSGAW